MRNAHRLDALTALVRLAVPNADGVSIGRWENKETWRVTPPSLTSSEHAAARSVFASFDVEAHQPPDPSALDTLAPDLKVLALCLAQIVGVTVPQLKAKFKQTWDTVHGKG